MSQIPKRRSTPFGARWEVVCGLFLFAIPLVTAGAAATKIKALQDEKDNRPLDRENPIERELAGGQVHSYSINLVSGQYLSLIVDQRGIDIFVAVFGPDGEKIEEVDSPNGANGPEPVSLVASVSGNYILNVQSLNRSVAPGRYEIKVNELRTATQQDKTRIAAQRLFAGGLSLLIEGSAESREAAIKKYEEALTLWRAISDRNSEAATLHYLAIVNNSLGHKQKALDLFEQTLLIERSTGSRAGEATALRYIGFVYDSLGDRQRALNYYEQALPLLRVVGDRFGEETTLNNMGATYTQLDQKEKALEYYVQALPIEQAIGDRDGEAATLNNMGTLYQSLGERQKALDYYERALTLERVVADRDGEGSTLNHMGRIYQSGGNSQKARECYERALALKRAIGDRNGEAVSLYGVARVERDVGRLTNARAQIEAALNISESLRYNIGSPDLRASYIASVHQHYEFYVDLLMRLHNAQPSAGFAAEALQASERARARSLLDLLAESSLDIRQGVDKNLLDRELTLRRMINQKSERRMRLLNGGHSESQAETIGKELDALTTEYQQVQAHIKETSPRYAMLTLPQTLSLTQIQQQVLDADTLLLEYSLGDERSYLWAVTQSSISSFELPARSLVESSARRVYDLLTARNRRDKHESLEQRRIRLVHAETAYLEAASALSRTILSPAATLMRGKRVLIVCEGALQFVPFAVLPIPVVGVLTSEANDTLSLNSKLRAQSTRSVPLGLEHEIVSLPSASVLMALRHDLQGRKPAAGAVAVLADPVFDQDDDRLRRVSKVRRGTTGSAAIATSPGHATDMTQAVRDVRLTDDGGHISRLPFSRREAGAIMAVVPRGECKIALDFKASRSTAASSELGHYRIVHFATHGLLDSEHPELSGIVLSLVNEQGALQDGFLRLHDIYNLNLPAELVVLSACQTGLGKDIRGEGLVGLTRGFMYAGAARVVASLWQVDDVATAELMRHFYRGMMREGLRPAAALRLAQIEMWKQKRWKSPYYWAAFVLQGEWK